MIYEAHRALGAWSVRLDPDTPGHVLDAIGFPDHVTVWHAVDYPIGVVGDAGLAEAAYTGVVRRRVRSSRRSGHLIEGPGLAWWLGDEEGKGRIYGRNGGGGYALSGATFLQALDGLDDGGIAAGTYYPQPGTITHTYQFQVLRDILDHVCNRFGCEWRVNPDATLDAGTAAELFVADPVAILTRHRSGPEHYISAPGDIDVDVDGADYSSFIVGLVTDASGNAIYGAHRDQADNPGGLPYVDLHGQPVTVARLINAAGDAGADLTATVQLQFQRFNRLKRSAKLSTADGYELLRGGAAVGDAVFVYDPELGFVDPDNPVAFGGDVITPATSTVSGIRWDLRRDRHTVAHRAQDGTWTDLTRWIIDEPGNTLFEVGPLPRPSGRRTVAAGQSATVSGQRTVA